MTTHTFNGSFSRTTQVSRYQKDKTNLDLTEARDSGWQWHQLGHMQVCTSLQADNHASTPPLKINDQCEIYCILATVKSVKNIPVIYRLAGRLDDDASCAATCDHIGPVRDIACFPTYPCYPLVVHLSISSLFPYSSPPVIIFSFENRPASFPGRMS